jgi:FAD/FMN-containing dehydrogenase
MWLDWRGRYRGRAVAVVKPGSTAEVASVVKYCADRRLAIVPQGGNTGMCGAATPDDHAGNVVIRLDRMRAVRDVSPLANTITVEARLHLAEVQMRPRSVDRYFPLSLGPRVPARSAATSRPMPAAQPSCATADRAISCSGSKPVLPDGRIFNGLRALRKDNTGYALKQLFIGAEGTLGIVTAAVLKLFAPPRSSALALLKLHDVEQGPADHAAPARRRRGPLGSLEIMSRSQIEAIAATVPHVAIPFELTTQWYLIVETDRHAGRDRPQRAARRRAFGRDGMQAWPRMPVLASSLAQAKAIWAVRHSVSEGKQAQRLTWCRTTAWVPLERQAAFVSNVEARINAAVPHARRGDAWPYRRWQHSRVALIDRDAMPRS